MTGMMRNVHCYFQVKPSKGGRKALRRAKQRIFPWFRGVVGDPRGPKAAIVSPPPEPLSRYFEWQGHFPSPYCHWKWQRRLMVPFLGRFGGGGRGDKGQGPP
jgi:hypothetical protein